jgi:dienelactone hydrolase
MTRIDSGKIEAYVATANGTMHPHAALLFLPDVIGIWQNSKLMADQFGANGYYTLMPDLFNGDSLALNRPPDFDLQKWKTYGSDGKNPHTTKEIDPIIEVAVQELRAQGYKKIGAVGYCFGAKYVCRFLAGKGIDVAYCAHPVSSSPLLFLPLLVPQPPFL